MSLKTILTYAVPLFEMAVKLIAAVQAQIKESKELSEAEKNDFNTRIQKAQDKVKEWV